jgi:hypothetical protein
MSATIETTQPVIAPCPAVPGAYPELVCYDFMGPNYYVRVDCDEVGGWMIHGPSRRTAQAAIAAWNETWGRM